MDRETPSKETVIAGRKLSDQGADAQQSPRLILASGSPRRLELLRNLQLEVDVIPSLIEEEISADLAPAELTVGLALAKALAVAGSTLEESSPPTLVLAADTIVVLEGVVIGKPGSKEEAIQILGRLSGRRHEVYTGVALIEHPSNRRLTAYERSSVYFRSITSREIEAYVHTREPMTRPALMRSRALAPSSWSELRAASATLSDCRCRWWCACSASSA